MSNDRLENRERSFEELERELNQYFEDALREIGEQYNIDIKNIDSAFENFKSQIKTELGGNSDSTEFGEIDNKLRAEKENQLKVAKDRARDNKSIAKDTFNKRKSYLEADVERKRDALFKAYGVKREKRKGKFFSEYKTVFVSVILLFFAVFMLIIALGKTKDAELKLRIGEIESSIKFTFETQNYVTNKIGVKEFVQSEVGDYYKVDLKLASTKERILFPRGKYFLKKDKDDLLYSINRFRKDVYDTLQQNLRVSIYVKGTADILGDEKFKDTLKSPYDLANGYTEIEFYPMAERSGIYLKTRETYYLDSIYSNKDLPNLRARFLQQMFVESDVNLKKPMILEGNVSNEVSKNERNAYLIMFVDWSSANTGSNYYVIYYILAIIFFVIAVVYFIIKSKKAPNKAYATMPPYWKISD